MMKQAVRYVAEVSHAREVSLLGMANLAFWRERLSTENLVPAERDGKAQIMIVGATMRFMGIGFTEVGYLVLLSGHEEAAGKGGAFLFQAFNSSRLFAWCERALFATPYLHAHCHVSVSSPISIQLVMGGELAFQAGMQANSEAPRRQPSRLGEETWEGPVFLPRGCRGRAGKGRFFLAKMQGQTAAYPFMREEDALSIMPSQGAGIFRALLDSGFTGEEWVVREDATHGKSMTYVREQHSCSAGPTQHSTP
jgi:hypothetical protein